MRKYTVLNIIKFDEKKAVVTYTYNGSIPKMSNRALYTEKGKTLVLFKGLKVEVEFNDSDAVEAIKSTERYNEEDDNANIEVEFDLDSEVEVEVEKPENKIDVSKLKQSSEVKHKKFNEIKACLEVDVPVYLYGPAGSGKNHTLKQIADELGLDFYYTNSVQQEFKITGFIDAGGTYHETEFYKAFKHGGLFFLDEMDASIPEVLVLLNAAIANGYFEFPNGKIDAHEDFRVVSAGNTVGAGADEEYTGRLQLDQATLDRFAMIEFDYDQNIELVIAKNNEELVNFVRDLRKQSEEKGIQATFSYRCITMVTQLEGKINLQEIMKIAVVKGMDEDTVRTYETSPSNKYSKALWAAYKAS